MLLCHSVLISSNKIKYSAMATMGVMILDIMIYKIKNSSMVISCGDNSIYRDVT